MSLIYFMVLFCLSAPVKEAHAKELFKDGTDKPLYVAGLHLPPFIIKAAHKNEKTTGIIADLTREILKRAGRKTAFKISNWPRAIKEAEFGIVDAIIPAIKSPDREKFLFYPELPILVLDFVLITQKERHINFDGDLASLAKYKILKLRKARVTPAFDKAVKQGALITEARSSFSQMIKAVASKRADLAAVNNFNFYNLVHQNGLSDKIQVLRPSLGQSPVYLSFSQKQISAGLATQTSEIILKLIKDGTYDAILKKYIGQNIDTKILTDQILSFKN